MKSSGFNSIEAKVYFVRYCKVDLSSFFKFFLFNLPFNLLERWLANDICSPGVTLPRYNCIDPDIVRKVLVLSFRWYFPPKFGPFPVKNIHILIPLHFFFLWCQLVVVTRCSLLKLLKFVHSTGHWSQFNVIYRK